MENKKRIYIIAAITLILLIAFVLLMVKMITLNGECIDKPFEYAAERLKESGGNYMCSCQALDEKLLSFNFNEEGIEIIEPIRNEVYINSGVNYSDIFKDLIVDERG